jgi:hypothetical protein
MIHNVPYDTTYDTSTVNTMFSDWMMIENIKYTFSYYAAVTLEPTILPTMPLIFQEPQ